MIAVMRSLCRKKQLQQLWSQCVDHVVLYVNSETLLAHLERCYGPHIRDTYDINAGKGACRRANTFCADPWLYARTTLAEFLLENQNRESVEIG